MPEIPHGVYKINFRKHDFLCRYDVSREKEDFFYLHVCFIGNNDGEKGPCTGDSGGGFMMLRNAKWTLRGIVSVALEDPSNKSCDLTKYFIFADVAKVIKWIKGAMT